MWIFNEVFWFYPTLYEAVIRLYIDLSFSCFWKKKKKLHTLKWYKNVFGVAGTYNQRLRRNNPTKTSWPELVGVTVEEAKRKIKEEMSEVKIEVVSPGFCVTLDLRYDRVRLYVDEFNKVFSTPKIG